MSTEPRLYARRNETRTEIGPGLVRVQYELYTRTRGWILVSGEERNVALAGESDLLKGARAYAAMTGAQRDEYEAVTQGRALVALGPRKEWPIGSRFD